MLKSFSFFYLLFFFFQIIPKPKERFFFGFFFFTFDFWFVIRNETVKMRYLENICIYGANVFSVFIFICISFVTSEFRKTYSSNNLRYQKCDSGLVDIVLFFQHLYCIFSTLSHYILVSLFFSLFFFVISTKSCVFLCSFFFFI